MDYEQKYKEALNRAKAMIKVANKQEDVYGTAITIFPELKESEDELTWLTKYIEEEAYNLSIDIRDDEDRIKLKNLQKAIAWLDKLKVFTEHGDGLYLFIHNNLIYIGNATYNECYQKDNIDWLEKQGEKNKVGIDTITPHESLGITPEQYSKIVDECIYGKQKTLEPIEFDSTEDERIRKALLEWLKSCDGQILPIDRYNAAIAWLEKQGEKTKTESEIVKDYTGQENVWNNAHDFRPKHLQRCLCYDKYMGGVYCYVYDDISKYWCTQTTEEHDPDGDNHISDYADYRVTVWMSLPDTSFYPSKDWLEKQGVQKSNMYDTPKISIKDAVEVTSRMKYIPNDMKSIADFIIDYAKWDLQKSEWNQPTITVPLFRVLDALIQNGKPYYEGKSALDAIKEEEVDNANKIEPKDYNSIDPYFGKPINKVEPKFKVGDWIVEPREGEPDGVWRIERIEDGCYWEGRVGVKIDVADKDYHLWSIQDAKDGDVLYSLDINQPFIYKNRKLYEQAMAYCGISKYGKFFVWQDKSCIITLDKYIPATKEQRDTLFQKMKESGYEWDAEKKELKISNYGKHLKYNPDAPSITEHQVITSVESHGISPEEYNEMVNECIYGKQKGGEE